MMPMRRVSPAASTYMGAYFWIKLQSNDNVLLSGEKNTDASASV